MWQIKINVIHTNNENFFVKAITLNGHDVEGEIKKK